MHLIRSTSKIIIHITNLIQQKQCKVLPIYNSTHNTRRTATYVLDSSTSRGIRSRHIHRPNIANLSIGLRSQQKLRTIILNMNRNMLRFVNRAITSATTDIQAFKSSLHFTKIIRNFGCSSYR